MSTRTRILLSWLGVLAATFFMELPNLSSLTWFNVRNAFAISFFLVRPIFYWPSPDYFKKTSRMTIIINYALFGVCAIYLLKKDQLSENASIGFEVIITLWLLVLIGWVIQKDIQYSINEVRNGKIQT